MRMTAWVLMSMGFVISPEMLKGYYSYQDLKHPCQLVDEKTIATFAAKKPRCTQGNGEQYAGGELRGEWVECQWSKGFRAFFKTKAVCVGAKYIESANE